MNNKLITSIYTVERAKTKYTTCVTAELFGYESEKVKEAQKELLEAQKVLNSVIQSMKDDNEYLTIDDITNLLFKEEHLDIIRFIIDETKTPVTTKMIKYFLVFSLNISKSQSVSDNLIYLMAKALDNLDNNADLTYLADKI